MRAFLIFILGFAVSGAVHAQVSITSHGAVASSSTDNHAAITRAIADAKAKGVAVTIPAGTFGYRGVIRLDGVKMIGQGPTSVLYALDVSQEAIFMYGSGTEVRNLKLSGVKSATRFAPWEYTRITLFGASNFVIDSVIIDGSAAAGIQTAQGTHHGRITNNTISDTMADSIHMTDKANFITVENNTILNTGDDGIAVVSYFYDGGLSHDITARNNIVRGVRWGRGMTVVGGANVLYENNLIENNPVAACVYLSQEDSWQTYGLRNVTVQYNTIKNCGDANNWHGAVMLFTDGSDYNDNVKLIRNDIIQENGKNGIRVFGDNRNILLDSNRITGANPDYWIQTTGVNLIRYTSGAVGYVAPSSPTPTPTLSLTVSSPASGATVSGIIQVTGMGAGFKNVEVSNSAGELLGRGIPSSTGAFSIAVDTRLLADGAQTLNINAWDAPAGDTSFTQTASVTRNVNVKNAVAPPAPSYTLTVSSPASGATVSGSMQVIGKASGFLNVEIFSAAGALLGRSTPNSSGDFSMAVDTKQLSNGSQVLTLRAWDAAAGQAFTQTAEASLSVNVQNNVAPPADTIAPTVAITSPANGAILARGSLVTVTASASDNVGVKQVQFYLNNNLICTDLAAPYQCQMRLPKKARTSTIKAVASDAAGNTSQSSISVSGR